MHIVSFSFSKHIECNAFNLVFPIVVENSPMKSQPAILTSGRCAILRPLNSTACRTPNLEHWFFGAASDRPLRSTRACQQCVVQKDQGLRADRQRLSGLLRRNFLNPTETRLFDSDLVSKL